MNIQDYIHNARSYKQQPLAGCSQIAVVSWPDRSHELSPIEDAWDFISTRLDQLQENIDHLIRRMPRRVEEFMN